MLDRIINAIIHALEAVPPWFAVDVWHHPLLRAFGIVFAILLLLFGLSYIWTHFVSSKTTR